MKKFFSTFFTPKYIFLIYLLMIWGHAFCHQKEIYFCKNFKFDQSQLESIPFLFLCEKYTHFRAQHGLTTPVQKKKYTQHFLNQALAVFVNYLFYWQIAFCNHIFMIWSRGHVFCVSSVKFSEKLLHCLDMGMLTRKFLECQKACCLCYLRDIYKKEHNIGKDQPSGRNIIGKP